VAGDHTLIRYDRLGVGMSDRTLSESDLSLEGEVAVLSALLDELGLDRVSLIGGSSGSCTAVGFAASFPERVDRLVLYGSYPDGTALTAPGVADASVWSTASTSGTAWLWCASPPSSSIAATTVPCRTASGGRSRPRYPVPDSFRCKGARTFRGTVTSIR
jgi:pimeloyl-ACP methyl ester carboxylesterase